MHFSLPAMRAPRNPLLRVLSLLVGLAVLGVFLVFGLVIFGVLLVAGVVLLALRRWKLGSLHVGAAAAAPAAHTAHTPEVLEGEFVVIEPVRPAPH